MPKHRLSNINKIYMKGKSTLWQFPYGLFINVNIFMSVQTILSETPSPHKRVHINIFLVPKIPMKIIKIRQKVKSVWKKCWFSQTPPPLKVYGLYTCENVDILDGPNIIYFLTLHQGRVNFISVMWTFFAPFPQYF